MPELIMTQQPYCHTCGEIVIVSAGAGFEAYCWRSDGVYWHDRCATPAVGPNAALMLRKRS